MFFSKRQKINRVEYRFCGIKFFTSGKKQRGAYDMKTILELYSGTKFNDNVIELQHGWIPGCSSLISDLTKNITLMLSWNKRYKEDWDKKSTIPCAVLGSPFVHYRRMNAIEKDADAKGTIAYPSHCIKNVKSEYDIDVYCEMLRALPEEFHPITISLHHIDIEEFQIDKEYEKRGFQTICAFYQNDTPFYEAFYTILKKYKYATSNEPGSYTFYAVEMGIPFFIMGPLAISDNTAGEYIDIPATMLSITDFEYGKLAYDLFSNAPRGCITQEQYNFVIQELGMNDCISKEELVQLLKELAQ